MKTLTAILALASSLLIAGPVNAQKNGDITGSIVAVSEAKWGQPVTFSVDTTPDTHVKVMNGKWQVDQLYITYVCGQEGLPNLSIHASIFVGGDGQWSTPPLVWNGGHLPEMDTSKSGYCEAWLIHTNIKGKNHQIDKLDGVSFNVSASV